MDRTERVETGIISLIDAWWRTRWVGQSNGTDGTGLDSLT